VSFSGKCRNWSKKTG